MNRKDKLTILDKALRGQGEALQTFLQDTQRNSMPFLGAYGIVDATNCPDALLDVQVYGSDIVGGNMMLRPVRDFTQRMADRTGIQEWYIKDSAITMLDANNSQYDLVPLHSIQLTKRNYSCHTIAGVTIGDLRRCFKRCASSVDKTYISLFFDADPGKKAAKSYIDLPQ